MHNTVKKGEYFELQKLLFQRIYGCFNNIGKYRSVVISCFGFKPGTLKGLGIIFFKESLWNLEKALKSYSNLLGVASKAT